MFYKIFKLATLFEKTAQTVAGDMAIRIMHSLIPCVMQNAMDSESTSTQLAKSHLINVAKRYIERGAYLIEKELTFANNISYSSKAADLLKKKDYNTIINIGLEAFASPIWSRGFGGNRWLLFVKMLARLQTAIQSFEQASSESEKSKNSGLMLSYMNVLDGMVHNSASFLENMISYEIANEVNDFQKPYLETAEEKEKEVLQIMDAKELTHVEDIIPFLKNYIKRNPEAYLYQKLYDKISRTTKPDEKRAKEELQIIRNKKRIIARVALSLDPVITDLQEYILTTNFLSHKNVQIRPISENLIKLSESIYFYNASSALQKVIYKYNPVFSMRDPPNHLIPSLILEYFSIEPGEHKVKYLNKYYKISNNQLFPLEEEDSEAISVYRENLCQLYWLKLLLACAEEMKEVILNIYS